MRAAVHERYGAPDVVHVAEVPRPSPRADEVLVRVRATAVTAADARVRGARFPPGFVVLGRLAFGLRRPRRPILGSSFAGEVEAVGARVDRFAPGDRVCGMTGIAFGTHAEHVAVAAKRLARTPAEVSDEDAAGLLFGGTTALFFLRDKATVGPGTSVLVNGAAGAVGSNAVQLARHLGATVTAVTSGANRAMAERLGASSVIDYTTVDLADVGDRFDVVLDAVGNLDIASGRRLLSPDGKLLLAVASLGQMIRARGDVAAGSVPERVEDMEHLLGLVADGAIHVVIEQSLDLADIVEAHRRVDSGHKVGNIVVRP